MFVFKAKCRLGYDGADAFRQHPGLFLAWMRKNDHKFLTAKARMKISFTQRFYKNFADLL